MLESIRSRSSGIFAWAIAGIIIVTMALFGVNSYVTEGADPALYKEGDNLVTLNQYRNALQQAQQRALAQNQNVDIAGIEFKRAVLEQLIGQVIVESSAQESGYVAADESVARLIIDNSAFQVDGKFDKDTYDQFVASNFGTKDRYEELLKNNLVTRQLSSGILDSGLVLPKREKALLNLLSEKRSIDLVSIKLVDIESTIEVTDEQITAYYEENKDNYLDPEKVSVEFITLSSKAYEKGIEISDSELEQLYQENIDGYTEPELRSARHILFTGSDAETKAKNALEEINAGKPFAELAKLSDDTGSAENGGDLGEIVRGQMVEAFEEAAYALPLNTVSEPVSTEFGYHLIEVTSITGGESQSFDEVKEDLKKTEIAQRAEDVFFEKVEVLRNTTFENEDTLQVAAEELDLFIEKSELFTRSEGVGFFQNPAIRGTAFSHEVLNENKNSSVIEVTPTEFIVLRKLDHQVEQPKPLESIKTNITNALKNELAYEQTKQKIDTAHAAILESDDWKKGLTDLGLEASEVTVSYLDRPTKLPADVLTEIFSSSSVNFDSSVGKAYDEGGNAFLFKLNSIQINENAEIEEPIVENINSVLLFRNSASLAQNYIREKITEAMTKVDESLL